MAALEGSKTSFTVHLNERGKVVDIEPPKDKKIKVDWVPLEEMKPKLFSMDTLDVFQVEGSTLLTCVHLGCKLR